MIRVRPRADRWRRKAARHIEFRGRRITDDDLARWREGAGLFDELFAEPKARCTITDDGPWRGSMNDKHEAGDSVIGPPGRHLLEWEDDQAPGWIEDLPSKLASAAAEIQQWTRQRAGRRAESLRRLRRLRRLIIPCIALSLACSSAPLTPVNPGGLSACPAACARLAELGCPWAGPTPSGATCVDRCEVTERTQYATGHPQCVAVARDCDEADRVSAEGCSQ